MKSKQETPLTMAIFFHPGTEVRGLVYYRREQRVERFMNTYREETHAY